MTGHETLAPSDTFDAVVLPHLQAARRLARGLMRNDDDAEDVVQEATLRALRYFRSFNGGNARAWFLSIVRNTCFGWHRQTAQSRAEAFDEEVHSDSRADSNPETLALRTDDAVLIAQAMRHVPHRFREVLLLRELKGLSYKELATVTGMPIGTVMSSLSRGRQAFRGALQHEMQQRGPVTLNSAALSRGRCAALEECA
jgi:RNA polymerase sigma factor (sigma-70 family)